MHSQNQLAALKTKKDISKTSLKASYASSPNKRIKKIAPALKESGTIRPDPSFIDGGPIASVKILNALGYTLIDRPKDYSFYNDTDTSVNINTFKNKNIVTKDLKNLENKKIPVSEYHVDKTDSIFTTPKENRLPIERKRYRTLKKQNDPNQYVQIDLSQFLVDLCAPFGEGTRDTYKIFDSSFQPNIIDKNDPRLTKEITRDF